MKNEFYNNILRRLFALTIILIVLFTAVSCGNDLHNEQNNETEKIVLSIQLQDIIQSQNTQFLKSQNNARTIFPTIDADSLGTFKLYGAKTGNEPQLLGSYDTKTALQEASVSISSDNIGEDWSFILTAKYNSSDLSATITNRKLLAGENPLVFRLSLAELGNGKGSFSFSLDYSEDTANASKIAMGYGYLYDMSGNRIDSLSCLHLDPSNNVVTYDVENLDAGYYNAEILLYADTDMNKYITRWTEVIQVATNLSSIAIRKISSLTDIYTLKYDYNYSTAGITSETVTKASSVLRPTRQNYIFIDWYTDKDFTIPFVMENISGDTIVYAKWISETDNPTVATKDTISAKIAAATSSNPDNPTSIKVLGSFGKDDFLHAQSALESLNDKNIYVKLDFSQATGITALVANCFSGCTSLAAIILPQTVESIAYQAFNYCINLKEITIPASVTAINPEAFRHTPELTAINVDSQNAKYKSVDGVLYTKNGTSLVVYPEGRTAQSYTTPSSVTLIGEQAFADVLKVKNVIIGQNVTFIALQAFTNCSGIESITFAGKQTVWYGKPWTNIPENQEEYFVNGEPFYNMQSEAKSWCEQISNTYSYVRHPTQTFDDFIAQVDLTSVDVCQNESFTLTGNSNNEDFTIVDFNNTDNETITKWFTFETEPNKSYQIYYCNGDDTDYFQLGTLNSNDFNHSGFYLYGESGQKYSYSRKKDGVSVFTADSNDAYIKISSYYGKIAFRVTELKIDVNNFSVSMGQEKYNPFSNFSADSLIYKLGSSKIYFDQSNNFTDIIAYLDGLEQELDENKCLEITERGVHVLTLEVIIDGVRYSYSKQVYVE